MKARRVLVIDDDVAMLGSVWRVLSEAGYEMAAASEPTKGLEILAEEHYDLVISDLMMEGLSGLDVLRIVRKRRPPVPVVIMTGHGDWSSLAAAAEGQAFDYITKPVHDDDLIKVVRRAIGPARWQPDGQTAGSAQATTESKRPMAAQMLDAGRIVELRADGKGGTGLVTTLEIMIQVLGQGMGLSVQEWPLFSSARKGANVRGFMRFARLPIQITCQVTRPHVAMLFSEETGRELDFAAGMEAGTFVINTPRAPQDVAREFGLVGDVITVPGERLGSETLGRAIPSIAMLAALAVALGVTDHKVLEHAVEHVGRKRRLPASAITKNLACLAASWQAVRTETATQDLARKHPFSSVHPDLAYTVGAQSALRTSIRQKTSLRVRADAQLAFRDPNDRCTGCGLCLFHCPDGILVPESDKRRGIVVTGIAHSAFCKLCRECIETCPEELFAEEPLVGH